MMCRTCNARETNVTNARGDIADARRKLRRAQTHRPDQIDHWVTELEARQATLAEAEAFRDTHQAECTVIVTTPNDDTATHREPRTLTPAQVQRVRELMLAGYSQERIAETLDLPRHVIQPVASRLRYDGMRLLRFDDQPWAASALCAQTDPEMFFPDKGGSTRDAKAICATCPVRRECLDYALEHGERFGIWGGHSERERRKLARQQADEATPC